MFGQAVDLAESLNKKPWVFTGVHGAQIAALVAILKAARQLHLVDDLSEVLCPGEDPIIIPEGLIMRAISHTSEALRVDAMHLICIHPKMTLLPGVRNSLAYKRTLAPHMHAALGWC